MDYMDNVTVMKRCQYAGYEFRLYSDGRKEILIGNIIISKPSPKLIQNCDWLLSEKTTYCQI